MRAAAVPIPLLVWEVPHAARVAFKKKNQSLSKYILKIYADGIVSQHFSAVNFCISVSISRNL